MYEGAENNEPTREDGARQEVAEAAGEFFKAAFNLKNGWWHREEAERQQKEQDQEAEAQQRGREAQEAYEAQVAEIERHNPNFDPERCQCHANGGQCSDIPTNDNLWCDQCTSSRENLKYNPDADCGCPCKGCHRHTVHDDSMELEKEGDDEPHGDGIKGPQNSQGESEESGRVEHEGTSAQGPGGQEQETGGHTVTNEKVTGHNAHYSRHAGQLAAAMFYCLWGYRACSEREYQRTKQCAFTIVQGEVGELHAQCRVNRARMAKQERRAESMRAAEGRMLRVVEGAKSIIPP